MNIRGLWRRLNATFLMSVLNLSSMLLPNIRQKYYLISLVVIILLNLMACWLILNGVESARDADNHQRLVAFSKKWILGLGVSSAVIVLILALMGSLERQDIPFIVCGYGFFMVAYKILEISVEKRMNELKDGA